MATLTNTAKSSNATLTNGSTTSATLSNVNKNTKSPVLLIGDGYKLLIETSTHHLNLESNIDEQLTNGTKN